MWLTSCLDPDAIELAKELDGLPLALATAGAYLDNVSTTFAAYRKMYRESWLRLQKTTPGLLSYEERALYSTWNMSYAQVKQRNMGSAMLLRLWAYFDNEDLWFELLKKAQWAPLEESAPNYANPIQRDNMPWLFTLTDNVLNFNEAVRVLCDYGLLEVSKSTDEHATESCGYSMHACVHSWTIHVLNEGPDVALAWVPIYCIALHAPDETTTRYWEIRHRLLRHASRCLTTILRDMIQIPGGGEWALLNLGYLLHTQGQLSDAEVLFKRALEGLEISQNPGQFLILQCLYNLANVFIDQGRLRGAEATYKRVLEGYERSFGPEDVKSLDILNNLAIVFRKQGRLDKAERMHVRVLQSKEKTLGPEDISTLHTIKNLGNIYYDRGQLSDAEAMYTRVLSGYEAILGPEHPQTVVTLGNLGNVYKGQGRHSESEALHRRALQGLENTLGPEHRSTLNAASNLAGIFVEQGSFVDAEALYKRALQGLENTLGSEHLDTVRTAGNLAIIYERQGLHSEAEVLYARALQGYEVERLT